ncbi:N-acetyltransferase family protein [Aestuariicoccus sp. MJ-SS9]|uniref:GNAT family N-acetyltransferase n=1 Tax=Aestuariicoccus sp. MJ-SS9 TaxID=3079855 RepID=UPI002914C1EE|nr:N-acetyltransferase family protein [Aestuariicoccus sp. MJ-SS9]MDU8913237.1 GNAT family N-acetyltransferase [Aestuariicoccus sp. MJ-SS9]
MIVRPARAGDAAAIAAIWNPIIDDTAITFTTAPKTEAGIAADVAARGAAFQVAETDGTAIGFATYFPFRGGPGYARTMEHSVMLAPEARGQGAGRALMTALEAVARDAGIHSLIGGVSGENPEGVAFHERLGFKEIARLPEVGFKFGRWMDLVLMQKML